METTQEQPEEPSASIKDLLDKMAWMQEANALHDAFIDALNTIPSREIRTECCLNTVRYMATQCACARASDKLNGEELANLFQEECQRFSDELLTMPSQFREWLKSDDGKRGVDSARDILERKKDENVTLMDVIISGATISCNCPRCRAFAKASVEESETPTERPPAPPEAP